MIHYFGDWYTREEPRTSKDVYILCWGVVAANTRNVREAQLVNIETGVPWRPGLSVVNTEAARLRGLTQEQFDEVAGSGTFTKVDRSELM